MLSLCPVDLGLQFLAAEEVVLPMVRVPCFRQYECVLAKPKCFLSLHPVRVYAAIICYGCPVECCNPDFFDLGPHFPITQCYNEHKFRRRRFWDHGK